MKTGKAYLFISLAKEVNSQELNLNDVKEILSESDYNLWIENILIYSNNINNNNALMRSNLKVNNYFQAYKNMADIKADRLKLLNNISRLDGNLTSRIDLTKIPLATNVFLNQNALELNIEQQARIQAYNLRGKTQSDFYRTRDYNYQLNGELIKATKDLKSLILYSQIVQM